METPEVPFDLGMVTQLAAFLGPKKMNTISGFEFFDHIEDTVVLNEIEAIEFWDTNGNC